MARSVKVFEVLYVDPTGPEGPDTTPTELDPSF